jgi:hypothetical protein
VRTISSAQAAVLGSTGNARGESIRVSVRDSGGTFRDLTTYGGLDMLDTVSWQNSSDETGPRQTSRCGASTRPSRSPR